MRTPYPRQHVVRTGTSEGSRSKRVDCSLGGWDPPWQWSWNREKSFVPFSELRDIPTMDDPFWPTRGTGIEVPGTGRLRRKREREWMREERMLLARDSWK